MHLLSSSKVANVNLDSLLLKTPLPLFCIGFGSTNFYFIRRKGKYVDSEFKGGLIYEVVTLRVNTQLHAKCLRNKLIENLRESVRDSLTSFTISFVSGMKNVYQMLATFLYCDHFARNCKLPMLTKVF